MQPEKLKSGLIAGVAVGILSAIPLAYYCCCIWSIGGGILGTFLYSRTVGFRAVTQAEGATIGAIAGGFGALIYALIWVPIQLLIVSDEVFEMQMEQLGQDPSALPIGPRGATFIAALISALLIFLLTTVGGVLGTVLFKPKAGPDVPPPGDAAAPY